MQEEVSEKTINLSVRATKMTAGLLRSMIHKYLTEMEKAKQQAKQRKQHPVKEEKKTVQAKGKQSLKKLMEQGSELKNIQITDQNIRSFDRVARKYGIDYSLKKDVSVSPPRYMVFFKAKDVDVMTAAFREYAGVTMKQSKRVSVRKKLIIAKERVAKQRERQKEKQKDRGQSL